MNTTTIYSSTSSVTGARTGQTSTISISARPEITYIYPEIANIPRAVVGFNQIFKIEGYNFDTVTNMYISAGNNVYTNSLSAVSSFDPFSGLSGLSALYPSFSGYRVPGDDFLITSPNTIQLLLSAAQNAGTVDIIIVNIAGYGSLYTDLSSTRIVNIET